jgi:hypothetical protein
MRRNSLGNVQQSSRYGIIRNILLDVVQKLLDVLESDEIPTIRCIEDSID